MTQAMNCPKCSGNMERGFIVDRAMGGANLQAKWVGGEPVQGFFPPGERLKIEGRELLPVTTFRCEGCGYLESYATTG